MQFCKDCGAVPNLFGIDKGSLCSACIQHRKSLHLPELEQLKDAQPDLLAETVLSFEEGKIVLRSKEGWELWSAQTGRPTELRTILAQARRIYEIRLRRQKN